MTVLRSVVLPGTSFLLPPPTTNSPLQSKPLIELQTDRDAKGNRILTCVYFPQRDSDRPQSSAVKIAGNNADGVSSQRMIKLILFDVIN